MPTINLTGAHFKISRRRNSAQSGGEKQKFGMN